MEEEAESSGGAFLRCRFLGWHMRARGMSDDIDYSSMM